MAIIVGGTISQEQVTYDRLHIMRFLFEQRRELNAAYTWKIMANRYGTDSSGNKVYEPQITASKSDNFLIELAEYEYGGDTAALMAAYTAAKINANAEYAAGTLSSVELMAYFELCMAHAHKLKGVDVSGIA